MMKKLTILAMLALLLAACGTTTEQTDDSNSAINQATAVEAIEVTEEPTQSGGEEVENEVEVELGDDLGISFSFMPTMDGFLDVFDSPVSEWDCSASTVSGDATDADDDGIAVNATYTIECTKGFDGLPMIGDFVTVEKTGTLTMQDADDDDPTSGYTSTGDITYTYMDGSFTTEHQFSRNWTGNASSGYTYQHSNSWTWAADDEMSYKVEHSHSGSYSPDDASEPFAAGQLVETATVKHYINGTLEQTVTEEVDLHLNKDCDPPADSGSITFTVNGMDHEVEFTGCGEYQMK